MKYLKLFAVFGALALVGAGSATLLDVFGTISGTADVKPALKVSEIEYGGHDERVEIYNPSDAAVDLTKYSLYDDESRSLSAVNDSKMIPSGGLAVVVEGGYEPDYVDGVNYFNASTLNFVDTPDTEQILEIETESGMVLDSVVYSSDCGDSSQSYHRISVKNSTLVCDAKSVGESTKLGGS